MNRDAWNQHVISLHRRYTGMTSALMTRLRAPQGETSYDLLVQRIKERAPGATNIVDIGCGDGILLEGLAHAYPAAKLTGVDLSDAELALARSRVPAAQLVMGDVAEIDMRQKTYDVVTSHLAFMVMPDCERVLRRLREAMVRHGLLAFVVEDPLAGGAIMTLMMQAVAITRERLPSFSPQTPSREPIEHDDTLRDVLEGAGFSGVSIEHFAASGMLSSEALWHVIERSYPFGALDPAMLGELRTAMLARTNASADAPTELALRLVLAQS